MTPMIGQSRPRSLVMITTSMICMIRRMKNVSSTFCTNPLMKISSSCGRYGRMTSQNQLKSNRVAS